MVQPWLALGERIKELRRRDNLTQARLAEQVRKSTSEICRWERGERRPKNASLLQLAHIFGVRVQELQQAAGYTPEMDWHLSFLTQKEQNVDILDTATEAEKQQLRSYLQFIRFRAQALRKT